MKSPTAFDELNWWSIYLADVAATCDAQLPGGLNLKQKNK